MMPAHRVLCKFLGIKGKCVGIAGVGRKAQEASVLDLEGWEGKKADLAGEWPGCTGLCSTMEQHVRLSAAPSAIVTVCCLWQSLMCLIWGGVYVGSGCVTAVGESGQCWGCVTAQELCVQWGAWGGLWG